MTDTILQDTGTKVEMELIHSPFFERGASTEYAVSLSLLTRLLKENGFEKVQLEPFLEPLVQGSAFLLSRSGPQHVEVCQIPLAALYFCSMHCTIYCMAD